MSDFKKSVLPRSWHRKFTNLPDVPRKWLGRILVAIGGPFLCVLQTFKNPYFEWNASKYEGWPCGVSRRMNKTSSSCSERFLPQLITNLLLVTLTQQYRELYPTSSGNNSTISLLLLLSRNVSREAFRYRFPF